MSSSLSLHGGAQKIFVRQDTGLFYEASRAPYTVTSVKILTEGKEFEIVVFSEGVEAPEIIHTDSRTVFFNGEDEDDEA